MFVLLFNFCSAVFVTRSQQEVSVYSSKGSDGRSVTKSQVHKEDITQVNENIKAHELSRKVTREETPTQVQTWHSLVKKAGVRNERNEETRMMQAMGFSEQFPGQAEKGRLDTENAYNLSGPIAGIEFHPNKPPQRYTGQILCDDGRCQSASGLIR